MEVHSDAASSRDKVIYLDTVELPSVLEQQEEPLLSSEPHTDTIIDLYPATQTSRSGRYKQLLTKRNLKKLTYKWRWPIFFILGSMIMGFIMWTYRVEFFQALELLSYELKTMGYKGHVLMSVLIFSSAFPPVIGYGTYQTLSGYTFGFQTGFPISYLSALTGACVCFSLSRMFLKARVTRIMARYPNLEAVVRAVEKKGFKLFILIRLSPYPFNLLNVLFAATEISLYHFAAGTAITLLKIALHVYIGANLTSFAKHILGEDGDMTEGEIRAEQVKTFALLVGSIISMAGMAYIYRVAKAAVKEANQGSEDHISFLSSRSGDDQDIELAHGFLEADDEDEQEEEHELEPSASFKVAREPRDSVSLDEWDAWGDEDSSSEEERDHIHTSTMKKSGSIALGKND